MRTAALGLLLLAGTAQAACPPKVVDATTLDHKLMMGYQGWFGAPGDGSKDSRWFHWTGSKGPSIEMLPDMSELGPKELFPSPWKTAAGQTVNVYSAYQWPTVARHFKWMRDYGIDGVMLQRFASELGDPRVFDFRNKVTSYVAGASQYYGRTFCIMYDVSGDPNMDQTLMKDWKFLVDTMHVTASGRYLKHRGKPLVAIWGIGFKDRPQTAEGVNRMLDFFQKNPDPRYQATVMGGVPDTWRDRYGASRDGAEWNAIYRRLEVISPWSVGGYGNPAQIDKYARSHYPRDLWAAKHNGQDYMPVVWPGFSWKNLHQGPYNQIPRLGGRFYWRQVHHAMDNGCTMIYNAMFDEVDEGTAMYKMVPDKASLPAEGGFLSLDADGEKLPSDWYLRLAGKASSMLRGEIPLTLQLPLDPNSPTAALACP